MSFDSMGTAAVAAEIDACAGGLVQQVHQPEPETVILALRVGGRTRRLLLSAHARYARAHFLGPGRPPDRLPEQPIVPPLGPEEPRPKRTNAPTARAAPTPPPFCMLLRKHLNGATLAGARQVCFDRVLHLTFRYAQTEVCLILEAMGKHSNLMLVSAEGVVLDAIKRVGAHDSRVRPVHPGVVYTPPPTGPRADPAVATPESVGRLLAERPEAAVGDLLLEHYSLGPSVLAAVLRRCRLAAERPAASVDPGCVSDALRTVADPAAYEPALLLDSSGLPTGVAFLADVPVPPGGSRAPVGSASEALEAYFTARIARDALERRRRELMRALDDAARFAHRRIREAEDGIEAARSAPALEREATLILSNLHRIPRGAQSVTVVDFYDPQQPEVILRLDPTMPAHEQAERRFRRARKLVDAVPHLERQWMEEQERLAKIQEVQPCVAAAGSLSDLEALVPRMRELGVLRERPGVFAARPEPTAGVQRRQIGGFEVLLGRNATENDTLTRQIAEPDDIWLHARGITSAHVVIRTGRHPERVPHAVLLEAAKLCALHSQAKHSRLVPVDYTLRKYVVKRRGSAPGQVQYTHEKTLHVEPGLD